MSDVACWNCGRPAKYKGARLCARCYQRIHAHGDVEYNGTTARRTSACFVKDCTRPVKAYGWCNMHWERIKKRNDPAPAKWSQDRSV